MTIVDSTPTMTPYGARYEPPANRSARARAVAREGIRLAGQATARWRTLPDYLVIGTKRGGTTSVARWLLDHPQVRPLFPARETRKGTYYFDVNYGRGEAWYRSHFPTRFAHRLAERRAGGRLLLGEATPYYLHHPHAPMRARRLVPDAKVIALIRNPIERAHGHWAERVRQGVETLSFADAVAAEHDRLAGEEERMLADPAHVSFAHQHFSYIDQGRYARGLQRWLAAYPSQSVLVIRSEDLYADPGEAYGQILDFLGLDLVLPAELSGWNRTKNAAIDPELRAQLSRLLAADIEAVESLLGRPMEWT